MSTPPQSRTGTIVCRLDGRELEVPRGRTVAAAIMLEGADPRLRRTRGSGAPRGVFCGIGACFDCLVRIDGAGPVRGCLVEVEDGMRITRERPEEGRA